MRTFIRNGSRTLFVVLLALTILFTCSASAFAYTIIHLGTGNVYGSNGSINYDVAGYVSYNSNTSTTLDVSSLIAWIYNYGTITIGEVKFNVHDGLFNKDTHYSDDITPVRNGENQRVEVIWSDVCIYYGYNTSYPKNSASQFVYTQSVAGSNYISLAGWECFWYPNSRDAFFSK